MYRAMATDKQPGIRRKKLFVLIKGQCLNVIHLLSNILKFLFYRIQLKFLFYRIQYHLQTLKSEYACALLGICFVFEQSLHVLPFMPSLLNISNYLYA